MANMSYCRFENTLRDLLDCKEAIQTGEIPKETDKYEYPAMLHLIGVCESIVRLRDEGYLDVHNWYGKDD